MRDMAVLRGMEFISFELEVFFTIWFIFGRSFQEAKSSIYNLPIYYKIFLLFLSYKRKYYRIEIF